MSASLAPASRLVRIGVGLAVLVILFVCALTAVYGIPQTRILAHAKESAVLLEHEGLYPSVIGTSGMSRDNFDDALMVDTSIVEPSRSALTNAMLAAHQDGSSGPGYTIQALAESAAGRRTRPLEYSKYWHGYQVFLRPALFFFPLGDIRYLNILLMGFVAMVCALYVRRALGDRNLVAFGAALLITGFYIVPLTLNFSAAAYLMFVATAVAVELERRRMLAGVFPEFWLAVGALTAFFDLFALPLLALGMPLVAILLQRAEGSGLTTRGASITTLAAGGLWLTGYAVSWAAKWAVGSLVLGYNVAVSAFSSIAERTGSTGAGRPIAAALYRNIRYLAPLLRLETSGAWRGGWPTVLLVVFAMLGVLVSLLVLFARSEDARLHARQLSPALVPAVLPFVWIALVSQHTSIHMWFTYRIFAISLFAVLAVALTSTMRRAGHAAGIFDDAEQPCR